jgi:hypothetical protein
MENKGKSMYQGDIRAERIRAMERDLQFLYFLFGSSVYKGSRPNLFERLRKYGKEAGDMEEALRNLDPGQEEALRDFELRLNQWKTEVYEFLESTI